MANLTIRIDAEEKRELSAWASTRGKTVTEYIKGLIAADMEAGSPESRAAAWAEENRKALTDEAASLASSGLPGADLALHYPGTDAEV